METSPRRGRRYGRGDGHQNGKPTSSRERVRRGDSDGGVGEATQGCSGPRGASERREGRGRFGMEAGHTGEGGLRDTLGLWIWVGWMDSVGEEVGQTWVRLEAVMVSAVGSGGAAGLAA